MIVEWKRKGTPFLLPFPSQRPTKQKGKGAAEPLGLSTRKALGFALPAAVPRDAGASWHRIQLLGMLTEFHACWGHPPNQVYQCGCDRFAVRMESESLTQLKGSPTTNHAWNLTGFPT